MKTLKELLTEKFKGNSSSKKSAIEESPAFKKAVEIRAQELLAKELETIDDKFLLEISKSVLPKDTNPKLDDESVDKDANTQVAELLSEAEKQGDKKDE